MKTETLLMRVASVLVSIVLLVGTLTAATSSDEPISLTAVAEAYLSFTDVDGTQVNDISSRATINTAGELMLGSFGSIRLDEYSEIALAGVDFDEQTQTVSEAEVFVRAGRVWLTNHVMGSTIRLADDQLVITNDGGALLFDKSINAADGTSYTRITAVSGASSIGLLAPGTEDIFFETALAPDKTVIISPELITALLNASDKVSRALAWESEVERAELVADTFYKDNITRDAFIANQLVDRLETTLAAYQPSLFDNMREVLTVLPAAKKRFWQKNVGVVLARAIDNPNSIDWDRVTNEVAQYPEARDVLAAIVPYARFAVSDALPDTTRETLATLAEIDTELSEAAGVETLEPVHAAAQQLNFAAADADAVEQYLAAYQKNIEVAKLTAAATEMIANQLAQLAETYPSKTAIFTAYFDMPTATDTAAANEIADYLSLARVLTHAGETTAAADVLSQLALLAEMNEYAFDATVLAAVMTNGKEINSQIAYVQSLHGSAPYSEDGYADWQLENYVEEPVVEIIEAQQKKRMPRVRAARQAE